MSNPHLWAALQMTLASAFLALSTFLAKGASGAFSSISAPGLHPLQVSAGRFVVGCAIWVVVISLGALLFRRPVLAHKIHWRLHIARSTCGWLSVSCLFWAASLMPLSDATAISFLNPVFAMFLAAFFLGEMLVRSRIVCAIVMLAGALVLLRPGSSVFDPAALIALAAVLTGSVESLLIKRQTAIEPRLQILFLNNAVGACIALAVASVIWISPNTTQWLVLVGVGLSMAATQVFVLTSLRFAPAGYVLPFLYSTLIFAGVLDYAVFADAPDVPGIAGALIIAFGAIALARTTGPK